VRGSPIGSLLAPPHTRPDVVVAKNTEIADALRNRLSRGGLGGKMAGERRDFIKNPTS
jgi:hypothetical protein